MPNSFFSSSAKGQNYIHAVDPIVKILLVVLILIFGFLSTSSTFHATMSIGLFLILLLSDIPTTTLRNSLVGIFVIAILTTLYHLIFAEPGGLSLFSLGNFHVSREPLMDALFFSLRLSTFTLSVLALVLTTTPTLLAEGVTRMLRPLSRIGIPVNDLWLVSFIAFRCIPLLSADLVVIRNSLILRGLKSGGNLKARTSAAFYVLRPLLAMTLRRSDLMSLAVASRGYESYSPRTYYSGMRFGILEWVMLLTSGSFIYALHLMTK